MINLGSSFTNFPIYKKRAKDVLVKEVNFKVELKNLFEETNEEDLLSFMGSFDFPDLDNLKTTLIQTGKYKKIEVEEIIKGLKTLPEYRD